jgi:hypothetical protein
MRIGIIGGIERSEALYRRSPTTRAVQSARRFARRFGVRERIVRRLGVARFSELLGELKSEQGRHACIG